MYFVLRYLAANNRVLFLFEVNSLVDIFTIPPVFMSVHLKTTWMGLRFLRALRILQFSEILQFARLLQTAVAIKFVNLLSTFIGLWLTATGVFHLLENSGDFWEKRSNRQQITYWNAMYMIIVTISTVGYGDITPKTTCGKLFTLLLIMSGLVIFASIVPQLADIYTLVKKRFETEYKVQQRKHLVVCGRINKASASNFLKDFFHKDRGRVDLDVVFMSEKKASLDLQALFKQYFQNVSFFCGNILQLDQLERVKVKNTCCCIILADTNTTNADAEDSLNIMRVVTIKSFHPETRIIIRQEFLAIKIF